MRDDPRRRDLAAYPFRIEMVPRFGDMDLNQHLNNVAVARFYEEGRVRFHFDLHRRPGLERFRGFIAHLAIDYLAEGHWPDPVEIGVGIVHIGGSSYRLGLAMFQRGVCIGLCDSVLVHRGEQGSAPLPPLLREALEGLRLRAE
jgi:acyl-CoA thioester hydrolase